LAKTHYTERTDIKPIVNNQKNAMGGDGGLWSQMNQDTKVIFLGFAEVKIRIFL
jgi:hypothetical protein